MPHPDIEIRINNISNAIQEHPLDALLLIKRADLYRQHQDWSAAKMDINSAIKIGAPDFVVSFHQALIYRETNNTHLAKQLFLQTVSQSNKQSSPNSFKSLAHLNIAEMFQADKNWQHAANHFFAAIQNDSTISTSVYMACARAYRKAGMGFYDKAIQVLDDGIKLNSGVISFYNLAIEIETERENYKAAIDRIRQLLKKYPRLEQQQRYSLINLQQLQKIDSLGDSP